MARHFWNSAFKSHLVTFQISPLKSLWTQTGEKKPTGRNKSKKGEPQKETSRLMSSHPFWKHFLIVKYSSLFEMQEWPVKDISDMTLTIILHQSVILDYLLQKPPPCTAPSLHRDVVCYNQRNKNTNRDFWQNYTPKSFCVKAWKTADLFSGLNLKINSLNHCVTGNNATTSPGWIQKTWKKQNKYPKEKLQLYAQSFQATKLGTRLSFLHFTLTHPILIKCSFQHIIKV